MSYEQRNVNFNDSINIKLSSRAYLNKLLIFKRSIYIYLQSDKTVDTFTFLTPYFITAIPFCPTRLCDNCCDLELQMSNTECGKGVFHSLLLSKRSGIIWCTKSTIKRQCVNYCNYVANCRLPSYNLYEMVFRLHSHIQSFDVWNILNHLNE